MTIRWKLNIAFIALVAIFLATAAMATRAVTSSADETRSYVRTRELAQFTANVRTLVYAQVAAASDPRRLPAESADAGWAATALNDIDVNIRLAHNDRERTLWTEVRGTIVSLADELQRGRDPARTAPIVRRAEQHLRALHHLYDITQTDAIVSIARSSFQAQVAIGVACLLTVLLLLSYMLMIRRWLIRPVDVLRTSVEVIGRGDLGYRVPLNGRDELTVLARGIDDMAAGLAAHQTELVKAREFSAIGEMCANVAHGLRNPLAAIRSGAQLAARQANGSAGVRESFDAVAHQADLMDQRIRRLFQFSRPLELEPIATRFADLSEAARARSQEVLAARQVELAIEDRTCGRPWDVDRERLAEGLAELVMNAALHSPAGSTVVVRGSPAGAATGRVLRIDVIDRGSGMPAATCGKAFDPFFTTRPGGTGMGLTLVRRMVEKHGGEVHIDSESGQGTTVAFTVRELTK
jgi:signal transduction histidine kinase